MTRFDKITTIIWLALLGLLVGAYIYFLFFFEDKSHTQRMQEALNQKDRELDLQERQLALLELKAGTTTVPLPEKKAKSGVITATGNKNCTMKKNYSNNPGNSLCSGFKVFPDGKRCKGCIDCNFGKDKRSIRKVFNDTHTMVTIGKKKKAKKRR
jgi:hypothetical protein